MPVGSAVNSKVVGDAGTAKSNWLGGTDPAGEYPDCPLDSSLIVTDHSCAKRDALSLCEKRVKVREQCQSPKYPFFGLPAGPGWNLPREVSNMTGEAGGRDGEGIAKKVS